MKGRQWNDGPRVAAVSVGLLSFLFLSFFVGSQATAQSSGNLCIKEKVGGDPPCTANDVRFVAMDLLSGPTGCRLGDTISVTILATLESGPERYDIGIWINESGGSALSDPDGTCYRDFLDPVSSDNSDCNQDGGPYYNGVADNDSCGDMPAVGNDPCGSLAGPCSDGSGGTCLFTYRTISLDLVCADGDGDGFADTGWATSWDNNAANDCTDEMDTDPGTGSKCFAHDFGKVNGIEIFCTDIDPATECCDPATGNITPIDDAVACTDDVCDPNTGIVTHTPDDGYCDDGLYCNGTETCDPVLDCQPGTSPCVPLLVCDEAGDTCVGCLTDGDCDDGVACTSDTCDSGNCVNTPDDSSCDDGVYCNGAEVCDPVSDCQVGTDPCDDGNACTDDICNEVDDLCEYLCNAAGYEDPCCEDEACVGELICKEPVCGDGVIDPGEECGEPGLDPCPPDKKYCWRKGPNADCACHIIPSIDLSYFIATGRDGAVDIVWGTEAEPENAGFNILRSEQADGQYAQINAQLIQAEGGPTWGADYQYTDNDVVNDTTYWYKLEDMDIYGYSTLHGPVSATRQAGATCTGSPAEASSIGTSTARPLNALYPVSLPVLLVCVWLGVTAYRRRR